MTAVSRLRLAGLRLALVASSGLLALALAEGALRFTPLRLVAYAFPPGYHVADPTTGYRLARSFPATTIVSKQQTRDLCVTNALGLRDVEVPPIAPERIVLVLGASQTYGWGATSLEQTWPRALDRELERRFPELEPRHVVNAGVAGYNHFQAVELYRALLRELPVGAAILAFPNALLSRNVWGPAGAFSVIHDTLTQRTFEQSLLRLPSRLLGTTRLDRLHAFVLRRSRLYFALCSYLARRREPERIPPAYPSARAALHAALAEFQALSAAHGVRPIVAYIPSALAFGDQPEEAGRVGAEVAAELGLPFLDPKEEMRRVGGPLFRPVRDLTHGHDLHYSPDGNLLYARALAPLVAAALVQPPGARAAGRKPHPDAAVGSEERVDER